MEENELVFGDRLLSKKNLRFNFDKTKKKVNNYFEALEDLEWELKKTDIQKGLTANYDFSDESQKQPITAKGKDEFNLSTKEKKEEELKKYISNYRGAINALSYKEQMYITEYFINRRFGYELADLLEIGATDSRRFRELRRSAIYKFADVLNLVVEK